MKEFIIVGRGLAANVLMHTLHQRGISFTVIGSEHLSSCSRVAAGIWNPVVFKRMTKSWLADELIAYLETFYAGCEERLQKKIVTPRPIIKPFTEEQEKKLWIRKSGLELRGYLDPELKEEIPAFLAQCTITSGYGSIHRCGNLDVAGFLDASTLFFKDSIVDETFDHRQLQVFPDKLVYGTTEAKNIIFCEGYLVKDNPFFNWIPMKPAKGEVLTVSVPELKLKNTIFNRNGFLMDIAPGLYKTGATYEWQDLSERLTEKGRQELIEKLGQMTTCAYTITKQEAGVRPSSIDRRPLIGRHPKYGNLYVFNGLGTKGVMLAPFFSNNFVNFYLQQETMHREADLSRFYSLYDAHHS